MRAADAARQASGSFSAQKAAGAEYERSPSAEGLKYTTNSPRIDDVSPARNQRANSIGAQGLGRN